VEHTFFTYKLNNRTALETIILDNCSERQSCWTVKHWV